MAGNASTHPAEYGSQAKSSGVPFSTVTYFWGSCAPATSSAPQELPGSCSVAQHSWPTWQNPNLTIYLHLLPTGIFSHLFTMRPLFPLPRPGWIWWGFGHPGHIRVLPALRPLSLVAKPSSQTRPALLPVYHSPAPILFVPFSCHFVLKKTFPLLHGD